MRKIFITTLVTFSVFLFSCGKKEKSNDSETKPELETLDMTIKFKYDHEDTFKVYYTKNSKAPIDGSLMMSLPVHPSKDFQELTFFFPVGENPKVIRLDVGSNQDAQSIEIKNIKITQGDIIIDNSDWISATNWSPNEFLVLDDKTKIYNIVPIKGIKSPVFMSNVVMTEKLEKHYNIK